VSAALEDGARSILFLLGGPVPSWARDDRYGNLSRKAPPRDLGDWYLFCRQVAERYGKVVDLYEVWNEPGWDADGEGMRLFKTYHFGGQVETEYLSLLRAASRAIRGADPDAVVVGGALIDTLTDDPNVGGELCRAMAGGSILGTGDVDVVVEGDVAAERKAVFTSLSDGFTGESTGDAEADGQVRGEAYLCLPHLPREVWRGGQAEVLLRLVNLSPSTGMAGIYLVGRLGEVELLEEQVPGQHTITINLAECLARCEGEAPGLPMETEGGVLALRFHLQEGLTAEAWARIPGLCARDLTGVAPGGRNGEGSSGTKSSAWDGKVKETVTIFNPREGAARARVRWSLPGQGEKVLDREVPPGEAVLVGLERTEGSGTFIPVGSMLEVDSDVPVVADRWVVPSGALVEGFLAARALTLRSHWDLGESLKGFRAQDFLSLGNEGGGKVRARVRFLERGVEVDSWEGELRGPERMLLELNARLGYAALCDAIAVHPYKSPGNWAPFYSRLRKELDDFGVDRELVVTEIGWPHRHDEQPANFSEEMQAAALGSWGLGPLLEAGCRKVWVYKLVDEPPGKSWDKCYFGLFDHQGRPHPSWAAFKELQAKQPDYPPLSGRGWSPP
jgi:hypothetical protein